MKSFYTGRFVFQSFTVIDIITTGLLLKHKMKIEILPLNFAPQPLHQNVSVTPQISKHPFHILVAQVQCTLITPTTLSLWPFTTQRNAFLPIDNYVGPFRCVNDQWHYCSLVQKPCGGGATCIFFFWVFLLSVISWQKQRFHNCEHKIY